MPIMHESDMNHVLPALFSREAQRELLGTFTHMGVEVDRGRPDPQHPPHFTAAAVQQRCLSWERWPC